MRVNQIKTYETNKKKKNQIGVSLTLLYNSLLIQQTVNNGKIERKV